MSELKQFDLPVDSEHKATKIKLFSFAGPHMRAFHICWISFFTAFLSTFGPAALIPVIRDALDLQKPDIVNAGVAAVTGTIGARVFMGSICDLLGARLAMGMTLLLSAAPAFGMALANSKLDFIMIRFGIGFGIAAFVPCAYWTSSMFNVRIVGLANATAAGWGNMGGGVTQLLLPLIFSGISAYVYPFMAWRWTFFVPGCMHLLCGALCLFCGQDLPDGNLDMLQKTGAMQKDSPAKVFLNAITNYRMLVNMILYACCFGVELTIDNIITPYMYDQFGLSLHVAGTIGALFGLMNIFSRTSGGWVSDLAAKRWGMRGRLWVLFLSIFLGGVFCLAMGLAKDTLAGTIVLMVLFSVFVQSACGTTFAVVPFVTKRSLGMHSGFVGAGGNLGSVMTQFLFFSKDSIATHTGIIYMGIYIICGSLFTALLYFPMWGSMFTGPRDGASEEDFYLGEFTPEERAAGLADAAMKFANESKSQRGIKRAMEPESSKPSATKTGVV